MVCAWVVSCSDTFADNHVVFVCCDVPSPYQGSVRYAVLSWRCVRCVVMSAPKHSAWVMSVQSISFACCTDRSGVSSGSSAGAGKCVSRKTWHFSSGVIAFCPFCFAMGSLGYLWAPVDQSRNWYISVGGLSSRTFLKNCFFFRFILRLNVLSVVRYSLSTCWGMCPHVILCLQHVSFACILLSCNMLSSSSQ